MLLQQTTASHATRTITDDTMRAVVTNELIAGQIIALLTLLHDASILDTERYNEFTAYLRRSVIALHDDIPDK